MIEHRWRGREVTFKTIPLEGSSGSDKSMCAKIFTNSLKIEIPDTMIAQILIENLNFNEQNKSTPMSAKLIPSQIKWLTPNIKPPSYYKYLQKYNKKNKKLCQPKLSNMKK